MAQLAEKYGGTGYAPRGALLVAKLLFDSGDTAGAKAQLACVIDRSAEDELKQIARVRLAAILFDDKQYDDALRTLDAKHDEPFAGVYADLRGDILAAAGRTSEARTAYQTALDEARRRRVAYHNFVQAKLDALGGPLGAGAAAGVAPERVRPSRNAAAPMPRRPARAAQAPAPAAPSK